jgi:histidinol phosphatase-like PHP family hydrolase
VALSNADLAELLCVAADDRERSDQQRRALRRAGRAAFRWPLEAATLAAEGRSLTELRFVGPWVARILHEWLAAPPALPERPVLRRGFLTWTDARRILDVPGDDRLPVRADLQMHTTASDGTATLRAMALAARDRGRAYIAITDHSKGLAIANGLDETRLGRQGHEIRLLNDELGDGGGFRVLRSVEMNLAPDGRGDLDPDFLATLDLVLGAFHSKLRVREDQTERYLAALANPALHVLAHPRGRIYNFRLGLQADWPRVFAAAAARDRGVEIDAFPDRQDLDVDLLAVARESGVRISIGSDAHAAYQLEFLDYGIAAARAAGIPDERILNCMPVDALLEWTASLRERGDRA